MPSRDPDKNREYKRRYKERHPERVLEQNSRYNRESYERHKERRKAALKVWRSANRDHVIEQTKAWREKNREKVRGYQREHKRKNPAACLLYGAKKAARQLNISVDLDREWFEVRLEVGTCELSGLPFDMNRPATLGGRVPNGPSIDRIDPRGAYTKENCRLILWWLNRALSNTGEEYALTVFRGILRKRGEI